MIKICLLLCEVDPMWYFGLRSALLAGLDR